MAAQRWPVLLLAILNLGIFAHLCDTEELRCQCTKTTSEFIPLKLIKTILVITRNIYCNRMEVIANLTNGNLICLDPDAKWVKDLVDIIIKRLKNHKQMETLQGMKFLYSVDLEKPLYLSLV